MIAKYLFIGCSSSVQVPKRFETDASKPKQHDVLTQTEIQITNLRKIEPSNLLLQRPMKAWLPRLNF